MRLFLVFLRQPDIDDFRNDPFWEFGSFGVTGCHEKNLLHPYRSPLRNGDRLAFLQGGEGEVRVVALSPPITLDGTAGRIEVKWDAAYRPLPYPNAPILINNDGVMIFSEIKQILEGTNRSTWCGAAGSRLRSKVTPVNSRLADQILTWFREPGLPEVAAYHEAIALPSSHWYKVAAEQGWAALDKRRREYDRLRTLGRPASLSAPLHMVPAKRRRFC